MRFSLFWALGLLIGCQAASGPAPGSGPGVEDCGNGADDDGDGAVDCWDRDCAAICVGTSEPDCGLDCPEDCANGADDDSDGLVDCSDPDCFGLCDEVCGDGIDNDLDGFADCDDSDCDGADCSEDCFDDRDNDLDGVVDCDDPDCFGEACREGDNCFDGEDNDADGAVDCADRDCITLGVCPELCGDGLDNDGDRSVDCDDADCDGSGCAEGDFCDDRRDNDDNGLTDCRDPACEAECPEDCFDRVDNDADGAVDLDDLECDFDGDGHVPEERGGDDCDDADPSAYAGAVEVCGNEVDEDCDGIVLPCEVCDDRIDNDLDGLLDCVDPDCDGECPENCFDGRDNDGDGGIDLDDPECDRDGDGHVGEAHGGDDCDDRDPGIHPDMEDVCGDGVDLDCDGEDPLCGAYVGSYRVMDGPLMYGLDVPVYNCIEACAEVFGGLPRAYRCSIVPDTITFTGYYTDGGICRVMDDDDRLRACDYFYAYDVCETSAYGDPDYYGWGWGCIAGQANHCWVAE